MHHFIFPAKHFFWSLASAHHFFAFMAHTFFLSPDLISLSSSSSFLQDEILFQKHFFGASLLLHSLAIFSTHGFLATFLQAPMTLFMHSPLSLAPPHFFWAII
jgi:hypothetical protein